MHSPAAVLVEAFDAFRAAEKAKDWAAVAQLGERLITNHFVEPKPDWCGAVAAITAGAYRRLGNRARAQALAMSAVRSSGPGTVARAFALAEAVTCHSLRGAMTALDDCAKAFLAELPTYPPDALVWASEVYTALAWSQQLRQNRHRALEICREAAQRLQPTLPKHAAFQRVQAAFILLQLGEPGAARSELEDIGEPDVPPERKADLLLVLALIAEAEQHSTEATMLGLQAVAEAEGCEVAPQVPGLVYLLFSRLMPASAPDRAKYWREKATASFSERDLVAYLELLRRGEI